MILTGAEIRRLLGTQIFIEPFEERFVNPNSYNLRLADELVVYDDEVLDMKKAPTTRKITIPDEGFEMQPGRLYLAKTMEWTRTEGLVPMLEGRSSIGRLGLFIHVTAGFGDVGFAGNWTLEMHCIHPIRVYAGTSICQIYYHTVQGEIESYVGKYQGSREVIASMMYRDFT
ncbi:MAG: dCTP deaminase [Sumerlaeia bacterium]